MRKGSPLVGLFPLCGVSGLALTYRRVSCGSGRVVWSWMVVSRSCRVFMVFLCGVRGWWRVIWCVLPSHVSFVVVGLHLHSVLECRCVSHAGARWVNWGLSAGCFPIV